MTYDPTAEFPFLLDTEGIDKNRDKPQITIFGSYQPPYDKRLEKLRDFLQDKGYKKTQLVRGVSFPIRLEEKTKAQNDVMQSEYWIQNSDILLWIFFKNSDNAGVSNEFGQLKYLRKGDLWESVVFIESDDLENPIISNMITGILDNYDAIQEYEFLTNNDQMLYDQALGVLPSHTLKFLEDLKRR